MEPVPVDQTVEAYQQGVIHRHLDLATQKCAYFEVQAENFEFANFSRGSPDDRQKYAISKPISKYFTKRYFIFSRFDDGIQLDEESWYSAIPEQVSLYLKQRFTGLKTIFEPFSGVGGIAVHLCDAFSKYYASDIVPERIKMLQHNLAVYEKPPCSIEAFCEDFMKVVPFPVEAVIICPPWGGINTEDYTHMELDELIPKPKLSDILRHGLQFSPNILLQLPKNTNVLKLTSLLCRIIPEPVFTIQKIQTNYKTSQLFIYFGSIDFSLIDRSALHVSIYEDLGLDQQARKNFKKKIKSNLSEVLHSVYTHLMAPKVVEPDQPV